MLEIKPQYKNKTVQVNGVNTTYSVDLSKDYTQEQLEKFSKTDGFSELVQKAGLTKEVHVQLVPKEGDEYPTLEQDELMSTPLPKLRQLYPFIKATKKQEFVDELIEQNYGNKKD